MKKIASFFLVALVVFSYLSFASTSYAASSICPTGSYANLCNITISSTTISKILTILLSLAAILSLFFLIWGAIRWIMSGGDKGKLDAARGTITASIVGLIIAFLAFAIIWFITFIFTGSPNLNFVIPSLI